MDQPPTSHGSLAPLASAPRFYVTGRQPLRPTALLLAVVIAGTGLTLVSYGLGRSAHRRFRSTGDQASRSGGDNDRSSAKNRDDPNQIDTIVLGDPADAPEPAKRGQRASASEVHPTILVRLPRFGDNVGLIPDTPAGHLLYRWLAAFNQTSPVLMDAVLPNAATGISSAAQMELRQQTGGFNLLSAREVQPGLLVFRLRDQTPDGNEVLGTLHVRPGSAPAAIGSFSLRLVPQTARK